MQALVISVFVRVHFRLKSKCRFRPLALITCTHSLTQSASAHSFILSCVFYRSVCVSLVCLSIFEWTFRTKKNSFFLSGSFITGFNFSIFTSFSFFSFFRPTSIIFSTLFSVPLWNSFALGISYKVTPKNYRHLQWKSERESEHYESP